MTNRSRTTTTRSIHQRGLTLIEALIGFSVVAIVLVVLVSALGGGCYQITGASKDHADAEAERWAGEQRGLGSDVQFVPGSCNKYDTDAEGGDGYHSCSFVVGGQPATFECAGKSLIDSNTGCRAPKIKVPATNVHVHQKK